MNELAKMMFFVTAGFVSGAVAGVLFAPEKGEVTREQLRKKANQLSEEVGEKYEQEINRLQTKINDLKNRFNDEVIANVIDAEPKAKSTKAKK